MFFCIHLIRNSDSVTIILRGMVKFLLIGLIKINLDPYYFMLIDHQVQDNIHQLRVMVQSFGTYYFTVLFIIGGYGIM